MTDLSADVIRDVNLFESPLGVAIGSLLLIAMWVILKLTKTGSSKSIMSLHARG